MGVLNPQGAPSNIITSSFEYQVAVGFAHPFVGNRFVPVLVRGDYFLGAIVSNTFGAADAAVGIGVNYSDFTPNHFSADISGNQCRASGKTACDTTGSFTMTGRLKVGVPMTIVMSAIAHAQSLVGQLGQASSVAWIDPVISIDSAFADAANYSLFTSPDVGNAAPVPVPACAGLLAAGFAFVSRRRTALLI